MKCVSNDILCNFQSCRKGSYLCLVTLPLIIEISTFIYRVVCPINNGNQKTLSDEARKTTESSSSLRKGIIKCLLNKVNQTVLFQMGSHLELQWQTILIIRTFPQQIYNWIKIQSVQCRLCKYEKSVKSEYNCEY